MQYTELEYEQLIGEHSLIYGETNSFKTYYCAQFVKYLLDEKQINKKLVAILDFAPPLVKKEGGKIGGKILDYFPGAKECTYIKDERSIIPPRYASQNKEQLLNYSCHNFKITYNALKTYIEKPSPYLIINDVSIHLQVGGLHILIDAIRRSETFLGNCYYGSSITKDYATLFSLREQIKTKKLLKYVKDTYHFIIE